MFEVPNWVHEFINKDGFHCTSCRLGFNGKGITGLGIKCAHSEPDRNVLFIEYSCTRCEQRTMVEIKDMELLEFAMRLATDDERMFEAVKEDGEKMEDDTDGKEKEKPKQKAKKRSGRSKITKDEYQSAVDMLSNCDYWEDWLSFIGADGSVQEESFRIQKMDGDESSDESEEES